MSTWGFSDLLDDVGVAGFHQIKRFSLQTPMPKHCVEELHWSSFAKRIGLPIGVHESNVGTDRCLHLTQQRQSTLSLNEATTSQQPTISRQAAIGDARKLCR